MQTMHLMISESHECRHAGRAILAWRASQGDMCAVDPFHAKAMDISRKYNYRLFAPCLAHASYTFNRSHRFDHNLIAA
jgi:hypothetical protein